MNLAFVQCRGIEAYVLISYNARKVQGSIIYLKQAHARKQVLAYEAKVEI